MRPAPAALADIRARTAQSYRWRTGNKVVDDETRAAMTDVERSRLRWAPDPQLVEQLCAHEQAFTASFLTDRAELETYP